MMQRGIVTIFFLLLAVIGLAQITVKAELENNKPLIGDQVRLKLEARYPENFRVLNIDMSGLDSIFSEQSATSPDPNPGQLEVLNIGNWDTLAHSGIVTLSSSIIVTCWREGVYYIPPFLFTFQQNRGGTQSKATNRLAMVVSAPIGDEASVDTLQLAPIKDIIVEPKKLIDYLWYILALAFIALILVLRFFILKRLKKKKEGTKAIFLKPPAHETALEKLDQLEKAKLWQKGEIKAYQSELTYIIREYLENRYKILALESTTTEIQQQLESLDFDQSMKGELSNMLQVADMVKFAKAKPPVDFHDKVLQQARNFVLHTKSLNPVKEYVDADGNPVTPEPLQLGDASNDNLAADACLITGTEATIPLKLYHWRLSFFGFRLTVNEILASAEGLDKHNKARSPFWNLINSIGKIAIYIPFLGRYILVFLFLLAALFAPFFAIADLVQGRKPLSRGLVMINRKGELRTKFENHVG